jgi:hypothetical protein
LFREAMMAISGQARPRFSVVADGMLAAGQVALMVTAVTLALLIFLHAVKRGDWQLVFQADRADQVSSEAAVEASRWP